MPRYAYVNGRYLPHDRAMVHVEDRGYQFADGVYEVVGVVSGKMMDERGHLDRLWRSLAELRIAPPMRRAPMQAVMRELLRRNRTKDGRLYIQITRGVAPREFSFPADAQPTLVMTAWSAQIIKPEVLETGIKVITVNDIRWLRRDIKSVSLLPQVLAKQAAVDAGAKEAWQVDGDGYVTEGASSNAWIVTKEGRLVTRQADHLILRGVTRTAIMSIAQEEGLEIEERPFTVEEAYEAREAFVSSANTFATPVTQIDDRVIANGKPGSVATRLYHAYIDYSKGLRGQPLAWTA